MNRLPILTLTLATFAIGTTEFALQGLLPQVASDLGVTVPAAGLLISGYALGVAVGGPLLVILTRRIERKAALLALMGVFIAGHLLCAAAPGYALLMAARTVTSFCHGAFFGIGSVVAAEIARADRKASAVAMMWTGIAAANILGVPAGTALGQLLGWRVMLLGVGLIGCFAAAAIALWLPAVGRGGPGRLAGELRALIRPAVLRGLSLSVALSAATFSVFTFIAPILVEGAAVAPSRLAWYLLAFGIGGVIGMQLGGKAADRSTSTVLVLGFLGLAAAYPLFRLMAETPSAAAVAMFGWGVLFYFPAAAIQLNVVDAARDAPNLASTLVQSGFNLGNAVGPVLGAVALSAGFGYAALPWIAAGLSLCGAVVTLDLARAGSQHPSHPAG